MPLLEIEMIRKSIKTGILASTPPLLFSAYLALVGVAMWQSNAWHRSACPPTLEFVQSLPEQSFSVDDVSMAVDFDDRFPGIPTWHTWNTAQAGEFRRVTFGAVPALTVPGASIGMVQLFDNAGKKLGEWKFWPGPEVELAKVSFSHNREVDTDVIAITDVGQIAGQNVAKQFFAFDRDALFLIRLEDDDGQILQNQYHYPRFPLGVAPDARTATEWIKLLESSNRVRVLAALTYLGGQFQLASRPDFWQQVSDTRLIAPIRELRANARIRVLIATHQKATSPWIREAAELAAHELK